MLLGGFIALTTDAEDTSSTVDLSAGERSACTMYVTSLFTTSCYTRPVLLYPIMPVGASKLMFMHIPFDLSFFEITPSPQDRSGDNYLEDAQLGPWLVSHHYLADSYAPDKDIPHSQKTGTFASPGSLSTMFDSPIGPFTASTSQSAVKIYSQRAPPMFPSRPRTTCHLKRHLSCSIITQVEFY